MATTPSEHDGVLRPLFYLPAGYGRFLGDAVANWSIVEHLLSHCIYDLLGLTPQEGSLVVRGGRGTERLQTIQRFAQLHGVALSADFKQLATDLQKGEQLRDMLAHSVWFVLEGTEQVFLARTTGNWTPKGRNGSIPRRLLPQAVPCTLADFKEPHRLITSIAERLYDMLEEIGQINPLVC